MKASTLQIRVLWHYEIFCLSKPEAHLNITDFKESSSTSFAHTRFVRTLNLWPFEIFKSNVIKRERERILTWRIFRLLQSLLVPKEIQEYTSLPFHGAFRNFSVGTPLTRVRQKKITSHFPPPNSKVERPEMLEVFFDSNFGFLESIHVCQL